ncbi:hypothetical protein MHO82_24150 [Vibrio sp. Of7-15]|uniref:hypothetical protein n=1 Tax=Vibrio sp. Of7-15 TaxID=2724879 RepID=UPI001EF2230E|nr:hypothetical protein [Vibrio sp. Of7-15]MCG7499963.1 hypothetical protein [Vibrio sp. Of7-15]
MKRKFKRKYTVYSDESAESLLARLCRVKEGMDKSSGNIEFSVRGRKFRVSRWNRDYKYARIMATVYPLKNGKCAVDCHLRPDSSSKFSIGVALSFLPLLSITIVTMVYRSEWSVIFLLFVTALFLLGPICDLYRGKDDLYQIVDELLDPKTEQIKCRKMERLESNP